MKHDAYAALRIRDFRFFVLGRFFAVVAIQMQAVIVGWQVYEKTHDPLALGIIGLCEIIPAISISLFAGHMADRIPKKNIIVNGVGIVFFGYVILFLVSTNLVYNFGGNIYPIYGVIFLIGIARGFLQPSLAAIVPELVQKENYANSAAWNGSVWQIAAVTGPAIGGLIYGYSGPIAAYTVILTCIALAFLMFYSIRPRVYHEKPRTEELSESLFKGVRFVFKNQLLVGAMSLDMFAVLFGGAMALLPIFASDILKVGPEGLGILRASPSVGASIMALLLAYFPIKRKAGYVLLYAVIGFGICWIIFGLSNSFLLSIILLGISGMFDSISIVLRATIMQTYTPDDMRGRVSAVNGIFIGSSNEIGAFESGVTAKFMGTETAVVFGGIMTILVVLFIGTYAQKLRELSFEKE